MKWDILKSNSKLRSHTREEFQRVTIMHDRTFKEMMMRTELPKLRDYQNKHDQEL